jgi:hypothetical protein
MIGMATPPESTKNSLLYRLNAHARMHWPQIQDLDVRYRGQFAYVQAELADGTTQPLIRLRYGGSAQHWASGSTWPATTNTRTRSCLPGSPPAAPKKPSTAPAASTSTIPPDSRTNPEELPKPTTKGLQMINTLS